MCGQHVLPRRPEAVNVVEANSKALRESGDDVGAEVFIRVPRDSVGPSFNIQYGDYLPQGLILY